MSVSMDEINFLVWRYMQENGFPHAAFVFETESLAERTNITATQIPPGALISLLQKSIIYLKLEKSIRLAKADPNSTIASEMEKINQAYPHTQPEQNSNEGIEVTDLSHTNVTQIKSINFPIDNFKWSPDSLKIAVFESNGTCSINTAKSNGQYHQVQLPPITPVQCTRSSSILSWNSKSDILAIATNTDVVAYSIDGKILFTISGGATAISFSLTSSSTNCIVVCSKDDYCIRLFELRESNSNSGIEPCLIESYQCHHGIIYDIDWREGVFSCCSHDKAVSICAISGTSHVLHGHTAPVTNVSFNSTGSLLASSSDDGSVRIWKENRVSNVLKGHSAGISSIKWHTTMPNIIASSSLDGTVKLWDALSGECVNTFAHHMNGISSLDIHPSGKLIVTGGRDGVFALWRINCENENVAPSGDNANSNSSIFNVKMVVAYSNQSNITKVEFSHNGQYLGVSFEELNMALLRITDDILA